VTTGLALSFPPSRFDGWSLLAQRYHYMPISNAIPFDIGKRAQDTRRN
jgi:hypothetical protein